VPTGVACRVGGLRRGLSTHCAPSLAQMIHQSDLATWLVRVVGRSLVILFVCPLIAGGIGAAIDAPELVALGGVVGFLALLFYLTGTVAPYPSDTVVGLLDGDGAVDS